MSGKFERPVTCNQCGVVWGVDFAALAKPDTTTYKGPNNDIRIEVFSVSCPNGHRNTIEVTFGEAGDG